MSGKGCKGLGGGGDEAILTGKILLNYSKETLILYKSSFICSIQV